MRQSLAGAAARGVSNEAIAAEKRRLFEAGDIEGLFALNRSLFGTAVMMAEKDDDADDSGDDDADDSSNDESDDDGDSDEDSDDGDKPPKLTRAQQLAAEAKKYRLRARDYRRERDDALAELEKLKNGKGNPADDKGKDEDKSDDSSAKLEAENQTLQERLVAQQLRMEFTDMVTGSKAVAKFKNPKTAFRLLDLDDVEVDKDGTIEGLEDAIKALAKAEPYLLDTGKDDEDEDEDEVSDRRRRKATGRPTGSPGKGNPNRDKLVSKYPALRR